MSIRSCMEHGLLTEFSIWHGIIKNMNNFLQNCREASTSMPLTSMMMMLNNAHKHGLCLSWQRAVSCHAFHTTLTGVKCDTARCQLLHKPCLWALFNIIIIEVRGMLLEDSLQF